MMGVITSSLLQNPDGCQPEFARAFAADTTNDDDAKPCSV
jgi:hypothetical protein